MNSTEWYAKNWMDTKYPGYKTQNINDDAYFISSTRNYINALDTEKLPFFESNVVPPIPSFNITTGAIYDGINALNLAIAQKEKGYTDPRWISDVEAKKLHLTGDIRGHGVNIVHQNLYKENVHKSKLRYEVVYNIEQFCPYDRKHLFDNTEVVKEKYVEIQNGYRQNYKENTDLSQVQRVRVMNEVGEREQKMPLLAQLSAQYLFCQKLQVPFYNGNIKAEDLKNEISNVIKNEGQRNVEKYAQAIYNGNAVVNKYLNKNGLYTTDKKQLFVDIPQEEKKQTVGMSRGR